MQKAAVETETSGQNESVTVKCLAASRTSISP